MLYFSQRDPKWANHPLGWYKPGTIGEYGCYCTDDAMIAYDKGFAVNPATMDELYTLKKVFVKDSTGTYDLLPDNALDLAYPGRFKSTGYAGFRADLINAIIPTPDTYAVLFISTASVPTHFVIAASKDAQYIVDPWTGKVGLLSGYGGPAAVHKTIIVKFIPLPTPAPQPVYVALGRIPATLIAQDTDLTKVLAAATTWQDANRGFSVEITKGGAHFQTLPAVPPAAPSPAPVPPAPVPLPTPPPATPTDFWGVLQQIIVEIGFAVQRMLGNTNKK